MVYYVFTKQVDNPNNLQSEIETTLATLSPTTLLGVEDFTIGRQLYFVIIYEEAA